MLRRLLMTVLVALPSGFMAISVHAAAHRPVPILPEYIRTAEVSIWRADFTERERLGTFEATHQEGAYVASGDVDGDGRDELIVGAGPGRTPEILIYGSDGKLRRRFLAYPAGFRGGVRVAAGDVTGDGKEEIVSAPGPGMEPMVRIWNEEGIPLIENILAYHPSFQGGVHVAVGDVTGDSRDEIITTPGPGGGPHVRIFDGEMNNMEQDFFAFDEFMRDGITVTVVKTPKGSQIVIGMESWNEPFVRRFDIRSGEHVLAKEFLAYTSSSHSGVSVTGFDKDGDGYDEIAVVQNGNTSPEVRVFDIYGTFVGKYLLHDPNYRGGLSLTQMDWFDDGWPELVTVALAPVVTAPSSQQKSIRVDLADQRLYAYEHGRLARTFFISSGTYTYPTPELDTEVLEKIPIKDYRWNYGAGNPDNYFLPDVKNNLRISGPIYIHYAYWHNNFGYRMSHGCINVDKANAEWIYNWADVGTKVVTQY